jgi:hypothetical protein
MNIKKIKGRKIDRIESESVSWVTDPRIRIQTNIVPNTDPKPSLWGLIHSLMYTVQAAHFEALSPDA